MVEAERRRALSEKALPRKVRRAVAQKRFGERQSRFCREVASLQLALVLLNPAFRLPPSAPQSRQTYAIARRCIPARPEHRDGSRLRRKFSGRPSIRGRRAFHRRSEEHTSELQSRGQ